MGNEEGQDLGHLSDRELLLLTASRVNQLGGAMEKVADRVGALEAWRNYIAGGLALACGLLGLKYGGKH